MNDLNWRKYDESNKPREGQLVLIHVPNATQNCHRFEVKYFIPEKPGFGWGWYPGGQNPNGTYWVPLEGIPTPP
jgi:hypothetical protein